jgi:hypothetical protein
MADKKAATVIDAAKALLGADRLTVSHVHREVLERVTLSAYRSIADLQLLHNTLCSYTVTLKWLGFDYGELVIPPPGPAEGVVQLQIPGIYEVEELKDLAAGIVNAGSGRIFLSLSWGGRQQGTIVFRKNDSPACWVEVASYLDRKTPEAAVSCLLLSGSRDHGTPFDSLKKRLAVSEHKNFQIAKSAAKRSRRKS